MYAFCSIIAIQAITLILLHYKFYVRYMFTICPTEYIPLRQVSKLTDSIDDSYGRLMEDHPAHLTLRIETAEPIELGAFVGAFTSIASEYERYIKQAHPDLSAQAEIYVKEVRAGSIEALLLPAVATAMPFIAELDKVLIVEDFVRRWGARLGALISGDKKTELSRPELKDFSDAVRAIALDPNGSATLAAADFEDGERSIKASFTFDTKQARVVQRQIDARYEVLESKTSADYSRVLMAFTRSDIHDVKVGQSSGERVKIEEISDKPLALIYASDLAEQRIKHETRAQESVYRKGFIVDVNVKLHGGKPAGFAVTHVHQVIDLPEE